MRALAKQESLSHVIRRVGKRLVLLRVVLNPKCRAFLHQEGLELIHGRTSHIRIEIEARNPLVGPIVLEKIKVTG